MAPPGLRETAARGRAACMEFLHYVAEPADGTTYVHVHDVRTARGRSFDDWYASGPSMTFRMRPTSCKRSAHG